MTTRPTWAAPIESLALALALTEPSEETFAAKWAQLGVIVRYLASTDPSLRKPPSLTWGRWEWWTAA